MTGSMDRINLKDKTNKPLRILNMKKILDSSMLQLCNKKMLLLTCNAILLSSNCFAYSTGSTQVFNYPRPIDLNTYTLFMSTNSYNVVNNDIVAKPYTICFDLIVCADKPAFQKTQHDCAVYVLQPGETKSETRQLAFNTTINTTGWCNVYSHTQISATNDYNVIFDYKMVQILNNGIH